MSEAQELPDIDEAIISALVNAVGATAFAEMRSRFVDDLCQQASLLKAACSTGDQDAVREAAHALRGAALNIGLARLADIAGRFEQGEPVNIAHLDAVLETGIDRLGAVA